MNESVVLYGDDCESFSKILRSSINHSCNVDRNSNLFGADICFVMTRFGSHIDINDEPTASKVADSIFRDIRQDHIVATILHLAQEYTEEGSIMSWRTDGFSKLEGNLNVYANFGSLSMCNVTFTDVSPVVREILSKEFGETFSICYAQFYAAWYRPLQNTETFAPGRVTDVLSKTSQQVRQDMSRNMSYSRRVDCIKKHTDYKNLVAAIDGNDKPARAEIVLNFGNNLQAAKSAIIKANENKLLKAFGLEAEDTLLALDTHMMSIYQRNLIDTLYSPIKNCIDELESNYVPNLQKIATTRALEMALNFICTGDKRTISKLRRILGPTCTRRRNDRFTLLGTNVSIKELDIVIHPWADILAGRQNGNLETYNWFMAKIQSAVDLNSLGYLLPRLLLDVYKMDTWL